MEKIPLDVGDIIQTVLGALILWFLQDSVKSGRALKEEVIYLKAHLEVIKAAIQDVPVLKSAAEKQGLDLQRFFSRLKNIEKKIGISADL